MNTETETESCKRCGKVCDILHVGLVEKNWIGSGKEAARTNETLPSQYGTFANQVKAYAVCHDCEIYRSLGSGFCFDALTEEDWAIWRRNLATLSTYSHVAHGREEINGHSRNENIVIRLSNCAANVPCALCGERTDPVVGPELFLSGTWALVCDGCGRKYAPELSDLLEQKSCNLFDAIKEVFIKGKNNELYQVNRYSIRDVLRGETAGLPEEIVDHIRGKYF